MMKKILVPTDFSETADKAISYAIQLASKLNAEIVLMHAWHIPYTSLEPNVGADLRTSAEDSATAQLQILDSSLSELNPNIKFTRWSSPILGDIGVERAVRDVKADLVVMGTTGTSSTLNRLFGSTCAGLIGRLDIPMIAVPNVSSLGLPKKIVVATDLQDDGDNSVYDIVKEIASKFDSKLSYVNVMMEESEKRKSKMLAGAEFDEEFDDKYHKFNLREDDSEKEGILDFIDDNESDLLVMVSHQKSWLERLFDPSISRAIVDSSWVPVLVLPGK